MYYKVLTHDYRSPIQGGAPIFDGKTPFTLPTVHLDMSESKCAAGWNVTSDLATAFKIAGLWPDGRPSTAWVVDPTLDVIHRHGKSRASGGTILRCCSDTEIIDAITRLHSTIPLAVPEVLAWREALSRPSRDAKKVETCLKDALSYRGLTWSLKRFENSWASWDAARALSGWDAMAAWAAWDARALSGWDAMAAWAAWDARALSGLDAMDAQDAMDARDAQDAIAAWNARDAQDAMAAWDARDGWNGWDALAGLDAMAARDALTIFTAVKHYHLKGYNANHLTFGIRDAYLNGLEIALPLGQDVLGWI